MKFLLNKLRLKPLLILCFLVFVSCSKDSNNPTQEETVITVTTTDFSKTIDENPTSGQVIGTVSGSTNKGAVSFSIIDQTLSGALSIDAASGELKVADASLFDFETNPTISGTVKVANGAVSKNASVSIIVKDVNEEKIYEGSVELKTQQEVDDFGALDYTHITGSLVIGYIEEGSLSDINDLSPLQSLKIIDISLLIVRNSVLISTEGLSINKIGGQLAMLENASLKTVKGLNNVNSIPIGLFLSGNEVLSNLSGLSGITEMGALQMFSCPKILNLDWLNKLTTINRTDISIYSCYGLKNIDGFINLKNWTGDYRSLDIRNNTALENLNGLQNLSVSGRDLNIVNNPLLKSLHGIENIIPIYNLDISENDLLQNLNGLENITNLLDGLNISKNNSLTDLQGLNNLIEVYYVYINMNENLQSLAGLNNLEETFQMEFERNTKLSNFCALQNLCSTDDNVYLTIYNNAYNPTKQDIIDGNCSL